MSSFAMRLLVAALVTVLFVGVAAERIISVTARSAFIDEHLADQRADAALIAQAMEEADDGETPIDEAQEIVDAIAGRRFVTRVELVEADGRVVAASDRSQIGELEPGPTSEVARTGRARAGAEAEEGESEDGLEYAVPVEALDAAWRSRPISRSRRWKGASPTSGGRR